VSGSDSGAQVPHEILRLLQPAAEQLGITLPGGSRFAAQVNAAMPISALALELGRLVARHNIFLRGDVIVTIDDAGAVKPMTATRFTGWVESFCAIKGERGRDSLSRETATLVLDQDNFRSCLRPLDAVHLVRLPVLRADGRLELLEPGYDVESRIFTVETLTYDYDFPSIHAANFFEDLLTEYPWGEGENVDVMKSRSASVQVMAMVGVFCRAMFAPGTKRPMLVWLGNQPGTGKSTLASMPLIAVFGEAGSTDLPERKEEVEKTLATKAVAMVPYVFFDDVGAGVFSNVLNRFVTASAHTGRLLGGNQEFKVRNVSQVFITGNTIKLTTDLMRRALIVELFLAGDARGRRFTRTITEAWLALPDTRQLMLSALWAAVRAWRDIGQPRHSAPLETFEEWTGVIAAIVQGLGFADPMAAPNLTAGGDQEAREWKEVLVALADKVPSGTHDYTRKDIVDAARARGLLEDLVGSDDDPDLNPAENKKLGKRLQFWRGRVFTDSNAREFSFGHRRTNAAKLYPCTIIGTDDAPAATDDFL
jgi:hypothetical protein